MTVVADAGHIFLSGTQRLSFHIALLQPLGRHLWAQLALIHNIWLIYIYQTILPQSRCPLSFKKHSIMPQYCFLHDVHWAETPYIPPCVLVLKRSLARSGLQNSTHNKQNAAQTDLPHFLKAVVSPVVSSVLELKPNPTHFSPARCCLHYTSHLQCIFSEGKNSPTLY